MIRNILLVWFVTYGVALSYIFGNLNLGLAHAAALATAAAIGWVACAMVWREVRRG